MKTILMAGGQGTRIRPIAAGIPKPMIPIGSRPVLEWEIETLRKQGFTDIILTVSYLASVIEDYFGDGSRFGVSITYYYEKIPLGNAGAVFKLWEEGMLGEGSSCDFLLFIADAVFDIDVCRFIQFHKSHHAMASLFTHPSSHPHDSGLVIADESSHAVTGLLSKEDKRPEFYRNRTNAGLHILNTEILKQSGIHPDTVGIARRVDLERDILKPLIGSGKIFAYDSPEYVKDMGTPERFASVSEELIRGRVAARSLRYFQSAVFINGNVMVKQNGGFLDSCKISGLKEGVAEAIKQLNNSDYLCIVCINQPVNGGNSMTAEGLDEARNKIETMLAIQGAFPNAFYISQKDCQKNTEADFLKRAACDYHIRLENSWVISDKEQDVVTGKAARCRTVLLSKGKAGCAKEKSCRVYKEQGNLFADNLFSAVQDILAWEGAEADGCMDKQNPKNCSS